MAKQQQQWIIKEWEIFISLKEFGSKMQLEILRRGKHIKNLKISRQLHGEEFILRKMTHECLKTISQSNKWEICISV